MIIDSHCHLDYDPLVNNIEIHNYLKNIIQLCSEVNKYVNDSAPWSIKEDNI